MRAVRAILAGVQSAIGVPGLILGFSFLGFGTLVRESDLPLSAGLLITGAVWALPAQVALVELYNVGSPFLVIILAVALTNIRLLPMVVTLAPWLQRPGIASWKLYAAAQVTAVTSWANAMRVLPSIPVEARFAWFTGFAGGLWLITLVATAMGYFMAAIVPREVALALVFLNPLYFLLLLLEGLTDRERLLATLFGGIAGPLFHLLSPDWALLATGLIGGTLAFFLSPTNRPSLSAKQDREGEHG